ncbi:MAG TPA: hypothetical protein VEB42_04080, partial [Chitinophagaceae bacterium]|nr:hypothetical protein [Chitinophagaceae bacterium]
MPPYVFRKYSGYNPNEIRCWSISTAINPDNFIIEDIVYSKGSSKAGTSIPSPLARMELFDTAFQIVATDQKNNLEGNTIYHQLVSDCLDVLQLLFNTSGSEIGESKKIRFREWKVRENIEQLKVGGELHPHYILGKSLEQIFFDNTGSFTGLDSIFLIYYDNKLLGGTSPLTLAFTSPNWSRYIADGQVTNVPQSMDGDIFFDNIYRPLHKRDKSFVEYLYKLLLVYKPAFTRADGLRKYINRTIDMYFQDMRHSLERYQPEAMDADYTRIKTNVENKYLTINGLYFYHQREGKEKDKIAAVSDFVIQATEKKYKIQYNENKEEQFVYPPLVLLNGMNMPGDYMEQNVPWNPNTQINDFYHRNILLYERKLPLGNSQSVTYPFITTEDFLEDILVEMPYAIDKRRFFTASSGNCNYLLPVKKEYFNFFNFRDLQQNLSIAQNNGVVMVTLKVPIRNRKGIPHIVFSKQYKASDNTIIKCRAGIGIYPFYQVTEPALSMLNDYTILLANKEETELKDERIALKFFNYKKFASDTDSIAKQMISRSESGKSGTQAISRFYKFRELFDYMEMSYRYDNVRKCSGLIIPDFENRRFDARN